MNRDFEVCPTAVIDQNAGIENKGPRNVVARTARRVRGWFRRLDLDDWNWELNLRLEERTRERERIARELHDTLLQGFLGASMQLSIAVEQVPADSPGKRSLNHALSQIQRVIDEGRDILQGLRTSRGAAASLEQALSALYDELKPVGVRVRIFVSGRPRKLNTEIQEQVYLIAREGMINASRHAQASCIEAEVEYEPRGVRVVVRDNGCGIDPRAVQSGRGCHWGLVGMRERAANIGGKLKICSRPGAGTEVEICVPS